MNIKRMPADGNINRKDRIDDQEKKRTVYRVDARIICDLIKRTEKKSFTELLHLASIDRQGKTSVQHAPLISDFISIAIHWNSSQCTTKDIEEFISIIDPWISLDKLFNDVTINDTQQKQVNLIGLICFYGTTIEVFFAYDYFTSKWLFCFDGNLTMINDWNGVRRKSIDYHLQPFLLIYTHSPRNSLNITPLLHRTLLQTTVRSSIDDTKQVMINNEQSSSLKKSSLSRDFYSFDNLSSFASLNSSMLFLPRSSSPSTDYINEEIVAKVMQQQLLKKESLVETSSLHHLRTRHDRKQMMISDETLSSEDSSTSSQRDSGLSSAVHDGSSDDSSRDSLMELDGLQFTSDRDLILASIEYDLEQSLKYESARQYASALETCQRALSLLEQIHRSNVDLSTYARTRKNSLLLRIHSLETRQIKDEELNRNITRTSILSSTTRLTRPKKNVKFSENIALILPAIDQINELPSEHLIHSFLRRFQQQSNSDSDSSSSSSSTDLLIGLKECSLCYKRFSLTNQIEIYCSNCQFYMQRFRPLTNA